MDTDIKCCDENLDKFIKEEEKPIVGKCNSVADLKEKYEIKEDRLILRLLTIKGTIESVLQKNVDYDELIDLLTNTFTIEETAEISLKDKLNTFLPTKTNEDILDLYKQKTIGTR